LNIQVSTQLSAFMSCHIHTTVYYRWANDFTKILFGVQMLFFAVWGGEEISLLPFTKQGKRAGAAF